MNRRMLLERLLRSRLVEFARIRLRDSKGVLGGLIAETSPARTVGGNVMKRKDRFYTIIHPGSGLEAGITRPGKKLRQIELLRYGGADRDRRAGLSGIREIAGKLTAHADHRKRPLRTVAYAHGDLGRVGDQVKRNEQLVKLYGRYRFRNMPGGSPGVQPMRREPRRK